MTLIQSVVAAPLVSPEASEIAVEKGSPIYNLQQQQQGPPRKITLGEATVDESSTDPQPPPPPPSVETRAPAAPPRPSKSSSASSSSAASTPESKDGKSDEEIDDEDEDEDRGAGASGVSSLSSQLWGPERTVEVRGSVKDNSN